MRFSWFARECQYLAGSAFQGITYLEEHLDRLWATYLLVDRWIKGGDC